MNSTIQNSTVLILSAFLLLATSAGCDAPGGFGQADPVGNTDQNKPARGSHTMPGTASGAAGGGAKGQNDGRGNQAGQSGQSSQFGKSAGIVYAPNVVVLTAAQVAQLTLKKDSIQVDHGALKSDTLTTFKPETVLVSAEKPGFWRYITATDRAQASTTYQTRPARIDEVVQSGRIVLQTDSVDELPEGLDEFGELGEFGESRESGQITTRGQSLDDMLDDTSDETLNGTIIKAFGINKDLSEASGLQREVDQVKLETAGTVQILPGVQLVAEIENFVVQSLSMRTFGALFARVELRLDMYDADHPAELQPFAVAETLSLCDSTVGEFDCIDENPTLHATLLGQSLQIFPQLKMQVGWRGHGGGSLSTGFELTGYISAGFDYERGARTRPVYSNNLTATPVDEVVEGRADIDLDLNIQLGMSVDQGGHRWIQATPLDANFRLDAATQPPLCRFHSELSANSRVRYNLYGLSGNRLIHEDTPLLYDADASEFDGCTTDNTHQAERCEVGAGGCSRGTECIAGFCVEKTPLRISLSWNAPVDLDLRVQNPDGEMLKLAAGKDAQPLDAGWIAVSSSGPLADEDPIYGEINNYSEIAAFSRVREYSPYRYWVRRNPEPAYDEPVTYQVTLFDENQGEQLITGTLAPGSDESVHYLYQSGPEEDRF